MPIVTHPSSDEYRKGFDDVWGRRCLLCRKPLDRDKPDEWAAEAHKACEEARAGSGTEAR
jgi:hypothetical protein